MPVFGYKTVIGSPATAFHLPAGDSQSLAVVIFATNSVALAPNIPVGLSISPGGALASHTDENGWVGCSVTFIGCGPKGIGDPDGIHYTAIGHSVIFTFPSGIWGQEFITQIAQPLGTTVDIVVQSGGLQADFTEDTDPPPSGDGLNKPTDLVCKTVGTDTIRLTWKDNSDNETGFFIERRTNDYDNGADWTLVATVDKDVITFDDVDVKGIALAKSVPAGQDVYRVFAFNDTQRTVPTAAPLDTGIVVPSSTPLPQIIVGPSLKAQGPLPSTVQITVTVIPGTNYTITGYLWEQFSGPGTALIKSPGAVSTAIEFDTYVPGTYVFAFTVSGNIKNSGQAAPDVQNKVVVIVPEPGAPIVEGGRAHLVI